MPTKTKSKTVPMYRVTIDGKPASISYEFHDKGVVVQGGTELAEFKTQISAFNLIARTIEARRKIGGSLVSDFKGFKPLFYIGQLEVQPFEVEAEAD